MRAAIYARVSTPDGRLAEQQVRAYVDHVANRDQALVRPRADPPSDPIGNQRPAHEPDPGIGVIWGCTGQAGGETPARQTRLKRICAAPPPSQTGLAINCL